MIDHGILNVPLSKRGGGSIDAQIDRHLAAERKAERARAAEATTARKAAREAEKARPKLTADDVRGARAVRTSAGWHPVVKVNAKSVTVATPYSWNDRIALDKILEARK